MIHDYIIIGSGPAGGNTAYNLNKAGATVLLLEAGKFFRKDTFPRNEADTSAQLYWGGGIEFDSEARMAFLRARAVGGTSIVNQCLLNRFDDLAFDDWKDRSGVDFFTEAAMKPYYDTVEDFLNFHTFTPTERNRNAEMFCESCDKLGYKWGYLTKGQSDCAHERGNDCIACLSGCHRDSKQSSMATYVQKAEKQGLKVQAQTEVHEIRHNNDVITVIAKFNGRDEKYQARNVIVAGGSFGTTKMLLQSGFKSKLPALGKYFSSHPQWMQFGIFDEEINSHKGYFQTVASKDPSFREQGFKLENVYAPPISVSVLFNRTGKRHQDIMKNYRSMQCIEVALRDDNVGEIKLNNKGKLVIKKPLTDADKVKRDKGLGVIKSIFETAGAKEVIQSPYYFGLHLMGGAVMGTDGATSVVDPEFRVHGTKNLYVSDSSIFPAAPGINPSLSIFALSQKLSEQLTGKKTSHVRASEQVGA